MGWLSWCQRQYPTEPWLPEGESLILPDKKVRDELAKYLEDYEHKNNWTLSYAGHMIVGVNPHDIGRFTFERDRLTKDIPFWAARWLVYDRDKKCQGCGILGHDYRFVPNPHNFGGRRVWDLPLDMEFYRDPNPLNTHGLEVHHIIRVINGGSNCTHNLALLCGSCHDRKGGRGGAPTKQLTLDSA